MKMKKIYTFILAALFITVGFSSCNDSWEDPDGFSSAMWYASTTINATTKIYTADINTGIIFWDISKQCLAHTWTVSDGVKFLKGNPDVQEGTDLAPYVDESMSSTTSDKMVTLFFPTIGDYTVTIHDEFAEPVTYKSELGDIDAVLDEATGRYIIDYTYTIRVTIPVEEE